MKIVAVAALKALPAERLPLPWFSLLREETHIELMASSSASESMMAFCWRISPMVGVVRRHPLGVSCAQNCPVILNTHCII